MADDQVQVESRAQWRAWLEREHGRSAGVWVVTWKRSTGRPAPGYEELVEEALCFAWVDSTARGVDPERTSLRFSPRKRGSGWARTNKERVARLTAAGLMAPAGLRSVEEAKADGSWTLLDDVENLVVPDDLAAALAARPPAREHWDAWSRTVRRALLVRLLQAKRPDTRARRIAEIADAAHAGPPPRSP